MHYQTFPDVIGDQEETFRIAVCEFMYGLRICRLHFENLSLDFRDLGGGGNPLRVVGSEHIFTGHWLTVCRWHWWSIIYDIFVRSERSLTCFLVV